MNASLILYAMLVCHGAFEYRTGNPDSLFPLQSAIDNYDTPVIIPTPALLPFADGLLLNSSAGRPYSEKTLTTAGSAIQYGGDDYGLQFSWNTFGADFYREHTLSLKAGYSIFPFLHTGFSENIYFLKIAADDLSFEKKISGTDFGVLLTPYPWINAAFIQSGIISLVRKYQSDIIYPERSAGILLKPGSGFSLIWNITETAACRANTFSAGINPVSFLSLKGGYCRENSSFAASIGVLAENIYITYGLKYHPYLGYTHSMGVTYTQRSGIETLDYGKPLFSRTRKKISLKTATSDELKDAGELTEVSAERIILYREKIGPVTEKSLMQIGLTTEEITNLERNVYGLERTVRNRDGGKEYKKFTRKPPRKERIKRKFRTMISAGIPAYTSITYSELSESGDSDQLRSTLANDSSLSDDQKKLIEKTCSE